ncbi:MAG: hypothetical protein KDC95_20855 [Planctomycetes bacterium]|nr:hypothetical protein [Planctomycetota bacterium]
MHHSRLAFAMRFALLALCASVFATAPRTQAPHDELAEVRAHIENALRRFVDTTGATITDLSLGTDGGDVVAKARVGALGKSAALRARLEGKTKPRELALDFGGVPIEFTRIAALGSRLSSVLPRTIDVRAGVRLREITLLRDVEEGSLESISVAFSPEAKTTWRPVNELPVRIEDLRVTLSSLRSDEKRKPAKQGDSNDETEQSRKIEGAISGILRAGTSFSCGVAAKLGSTHDDFALEATLDNRWRLVDIATALGGEPAAATLAPLPDALETASLRDAKLRIEPKGKLASLDAATNFGQLQLVARQNGVMVGIAPPEDFRLADLDASLRSLDANNLDLSQLRFVISSFDGEVDSSLGTSLGGRVGKGLNLAARLDLRPLKIAKMCGVDQLDLRARIPYPQPMDLILSAGIQTRISLGKGATFREVRLVLRPSPQRFKLALQGRMDLVVDHQELGLLGEFAVEPMTQTVSGTFALDPANGEWQNPFGIRGVGVPKLAVSLGATFGTGIPLPTLGLQAGLRVGEGRNAIAGNGVVVLNPRDPMNSMIAVDLREVSLYRMLGLASPATATRIRDCPLGRSLAAVTVHNAAVRIVPNDIDFAGSHFAKGYRIAGDFDVLGVRARGLFDLDYSRGLSVLATMDPIRLAGGKIAITGSRSSKDPILKLDLRTDNQEMLVSGKLNILGNFFVSETDLRITPTKQELYAAGKIFGKLDAELVASASTSIANRKADFYLRARMQQSLLADLRKRVLTEIDKATRNHVHKINQAKAQVANAQRDVQNWDRQIAATRKRVEDRQARDIANMRAAAKTASDNADREYRRLGSKIDSLKKRIKKQPWRAVDLGAEIGVLETRRNAQRIVMKTIGANLVKSLATVGQNFPKELSSELGPMIASQKAAQASLIAAQGVLSGYRGVVQGTMGAAKWIADNGLGNAFDLHAMQLETRVSTANGAWFACAFRGRFLGGDFATSLRLELDDPGSMASDIASALLGGKAPKQPFREVQIQRSTPRRLSAPKTMPALSTQEILQRAAALR